MLTLCVTVIKLKQVDHVNHERAILGDVAGHPFITTLLTTFSDSECLYMLVSLFLSLPSPKSLTFLARLLPRRRSLQLPPPATPLLRKRRPLLHRRDCTNPRIPARARRRRLPRPEAREHTPRRQWPRQARRLRVRKAGARSYVPFFFVFPVPKKNVGGAVAGDWRGRR